MQSRSGRMVVNSCLYKPETRIEYDYEYDNNSIDNEAVWSSKVTGLFELKMKNIIKVRK